MTQVGIRELKARLSEYIRKVKKGQTVEITEHGEPVARLGPAVPYPALTGIPASSILRDPTPAYDASGGTATAEKPRAKGARGEKSKSYTELLRKAQKAGGHRTPKETVTEALDAYVRRQQRLRIAEAFGQIEYDPGYDHKKQRRRT